MTCLPAPCPSTPRRSRCCRLWNAETKRNGRRQRASIRCHPISVPRPSHGERPSRHRHPFWLTLPPAGSGGKSKRRLHRFVGELRVGVMVRYASDGWRLLRDVRPPTFVGGGLYVFLKSAQLVTRENLSTKTHVRGKEKRGADL